MKVLEDLSSRETNDVLEAESDSLRQQFDSRKAVEARGRSKYCNQTTDRQTRLRNYGRTEAWMTDLLEVRMRISIFARTLR